MGEGESVRVGEREGGRRNGGGRECEGGREGGREGETEWKEVQLRVDILLFYGLLRMCDYHVMVM